ncbi:adenylyl-sulfate kinase [Mucilaginibacter jinjuensis]|uniref:Adenylyl-sulfate kinase n=1 Tax=Mucilaginibacter jinjuensis TaxID=1176721 RepID=A0ABY7T681_9SPHI|nr:adenylyl-sulfate kinase [Mucilaginibacter jinjuensis]WCT11882.1 adenylyl-sulfate kinase [Mucilaginibacter jinjuensis]
MITDILLKVLKKDPLIKRNVIKTVSWRIVGSVDTVILGWLITGQFSLGAKIGLTELLTKMLLYYAHERAWQKIKFGLPSKRRQTQILQKEIKPNLFKQTGKITRGDRERLNNNRSFTLWLTGLSGSGKSTLATETEAWLHGQNARVYILDGDNTRLGINKDLSFSDEDRAENIRRVAEMCRLFNDAGIIVIASFISPFEQDRAIAEKLIGDESFVEVYIDASIDTCQKRDTKGLYKLALAGKIKNFTGISSPYETPANPDVHLNTESQTVGACLDVLKKYLITNKNIGISLPTTVSSFTD